MAEQARAHDAADGQAVEAAAADGHAAGDLAGEVRAPDGSLDLAEAEAYLDALDADRRRADEAAVAALRAEGREPAPLDGQLRAGLPIVWFTLRWEDPATAEVRLGFQDDGGADALAWGGAWPERGAAVDGEALLGHLCARWPDIAARWIALAPEARFPAPAADPGVDLSVVGEDEGGAVLTARGARRGFGSEAVLLVEVLAALADLLAARLPGTSAATAWAGLRAVTDLPPIDVDGDGEGARDAFSEQTAWYAGRLGVDLMGYSLAAVGVQARQVLHAETGEPEPAPAEWEPGSVPGDADHENTLALARRAADVLGDDLGTFMRNAVAHRNWDARARLIYGSDGAPGPVR